MYEVKGVPSSFRSINQISFPPLPSSKVDEVKYNLLPSFDSDEFALAISGREEE